MTRPVGSVAAGKLLRFVAENEALVRLLARALESGVSREEAVRVIKASMTAASRERMRAKLPTKGGK